MNRSSFVLLYCLFLVTAAISQPTSRSAFFVANEGQWPGEYVFRYDGGGGSWFVTKDGLTIDLKQYQVSPQTGFGGTEGGYSNRGPFDNRDPETRMVKGHVIKVNLIRDNLFRASGACPDEGRNGRLGGDDAQLSGVAAHGSATEILDAPLPQTTVGVQNDNYGLPATQGVSERDSEQLRNAGLPYAALVPDLSFRKSTHSSQVDYPESRQKIISTDKLASYSNYFLGQDKSKWRSRVGHYRKVVAQDVWPGIDVEYRAEPQGVEMVFHVHPGADINQIQVEYEGLDAPLSVDSKGNLVLKTSLGNLIEKAPFAYQIEHRRQSEVPVHYALTDHGYRLVADNYDHNRELMIDPLIYSTYVGPGGGANDMCMDFNGNIILTGATYSSVFPTTVGAYQSENAGAPDGYVTKFTPNGRELIFSTYIGGPQRESNYTCVNDLQNQIHVGGFCQDGSYPLTENAYDTIYTGSNEGTHSVFSEDGSELLYSSYLGGDGEDHTCEMILDSTCGDVYVLGTSSPNLPTVGSAIYLESIGNGGMIVIFDPLLFEVSYVTYFPTSVEWSTVNIYAAEIIDYRCIWIAGRAYNHPVIPITDNAFQAVPVDDSENGFFASLDLEHNILEYSSYYCSFGKDEIDRIYVQSDNRLILAGITREHSGNEFPFVDNGFDNTIVSDEVYVTVIELPGTVLYGTCLGGNGYERLASIRQQEDNTIIVLGLTTSTDFPVTDNADDSTLGFGEGNYESDGFLALLSFDLANLEYGTYVGGSISDSFDEMHAIAQDTVWCVGSTLSSNYPVTTDAYQPISPGYSPVLCLIAIPHYESVSGLHPILPHDLNLLVFPNPFNPSTTISFSLPRQAQTSLEVFNVLGQAVYSVDLGQLPAGEYRHRLDAASLPSGTYLTRLNAGNVQEVKKTAVVR